MNLCTHNSFSPVDKWHEQYFRASFGACR